MRVLYGAVAVLTLLVASSFAVWSAAVVAAAMVGFAVIAVPVSITLWRWSRNP
ncbi:MAG TPA: hypothetical protein VHC90_01565 [Bryobacteraceae bacterium]|nr:hypothetical protein [Bryobacteraceae bacterium]